MTLSTSSSCSPLDLKRQQLKSCWIKSLSVTVEYPNCVSFLVLCLLFRVDYLWYAHKSPNSLGTCALCYIVVCWSVILEKTIRIPRSLSVKAASVLKGFLNKNPGDRLGCHRETGFFDIANHAFFKSIDWEMVSWVLPMKMSSSPKRWELLENVCIG